jgi:hypothetical protein
VDGLFSYQLPQNPFIQNVPQKVKREDIFMLEDHFQVLPQHKKMIVDLLKSLYKIDISDDYID